MFELLLLQALHAHVRLSCCRGDIAFCSLECRQQQMNLDEQREKCSVTSTKEMPSAASGSKPSDGGGTVAAA